MGNAVVKTQFFTFNQNNSGGWFAYDHAAGIGHYVIIEAIDKEHALARARQIGLYFEGRSGDCVSCCGHRWSEPWSDEGTPDPRVWDETPDEYVGSAYSYRTGGEREVFVHYLTGQISAY